jgi:hypothetical protein
MKNASGWGRVVPCRRTDKHYVAPSPFSQICEAPNNRSVSQVVHVGMHLYCDLIPHVLWQAVFITDFV